MDYLFYCRSTATAPSTFWTTTSVRCRFWWTIQRHEVSCMKNLVPAYSSGQRAMLLQSYVERRWWQIQLNSSYCWAGSFFFNQSSLSFSEILFWRKPFDVLWMDVSALKSNRLIKYQNKFVLRNVLINLFDSSIRCGLIEIWRQFQIMSPSAF